MGAALRFRFRNLSILKKMLLTLAVTFLIPLVIAGAILAVYLGGRDAEYESRQDLAVLSSVSRELAEILKTAEGFADLVSAKGLAWSFSGARENYRDYLSLAELSDDIIRNIPLVRSIILFRGGRVIFERGPALDSALAAYPEDLAAAVAAGGGPVWTGPRRMNFFFPAEDPLILPLYRAIGEDEKAPLVLCVGLSAGELAEHYRSYSGGSLFLLNGEALALSASGEDGGEGAVLPGEPYPPELFRRFTGAQGFFRSPRRTLVLYVRGFRGWYLVNHIGGDRYQRSRGGLYGIVLLAAVLGICFASACLIIQRRYIFNPLSTMLREMNQFREGNLEAKMSYQSGDEIGRLNREVEGIFTRLHDLIHEVYISRIYSQEATLKMLTSQINPHFLYNTLDSIRWKAIENGDREVGEQIEALSDLFRHILSRGGDRIPVEQEIEHLETYLHIMNFRYRDRMRCTISVGPGLENVRIPKLILQPLVENAIIHGIDRRVEPGEIRVSLEEREGLLRVSVRDNGVGTDPAAVRRMLRGARQKSGGETAHSAAQDPPQAAVGDSQELGDGKGSDGSSGRGFALQNIDRRIKLCCGEGYGLDFESQPGRGTLVTLTMPLDEREGREKRGPGAGRGRARGGRRKGADETVNLG
jgi:two-component system sensor histidine kinase YesM